MLGASNTREFSWHAVAAVIQRQLISTTGEVLTVRCVAALATCVGGGSFYNALERVRAARCGGQEPAASLRVEATAISL